MGPKMMGIFTGAALAGAGALCARHMHSAAPTQAAKGCPCKPGSSSEQEAQPRTHPCSPGTSPSAEEAKS